VDEYISRNAEFSLTFPASYELSTSSDSSSAGVEVTAHCVRSGEGITLSVVSPERSKDVGIKLGGDGCFLTVGETSIAMSESAGRGITDVFAAMYPDSYTISASEDGQSRLLTSEYGTVYVSEDGIPQKISCGEREITVSDFVAQAE
jgi:hypothetical protein